MTAAPIACTLSGHDFKERLAWIAKLNRAWLGSTERKDLLLTLTYDLQARAAVEQMVRQERACCPFLVFEIAESPGAVVLNIDAPEEAREAADAVFEPFVATDARQGACSCCGAAA